MASSIKVGDRVRINEKYNRILGGVLENTVGTEFIVTETRMGTKPVNRYLPPRPKDRPQEVSILAPLLDIKASGFAGWLDKVLGKI